VLKRAVMISTNGPLILTRFFSPFENALPPPLHYDSRAISTHKPDLPPHVHCLREYEGPQCFAIPGNHDWFDGLQTYMR